jgi:broad specificity phosphatase PhoE
LIYFRERNFGFLEGKCKWEVMKKNPEWFRDGKLIDDANVPDIESIETFKLRLLDGLDHLKKMKNKKIAIVTHGAAIKMFYTLFDSHEKMPEITSCSIHQFNI